MTPKIIEPNFARSLPVISTAAAFRYENDVPILIPGVNDNHAELLNVQRKNRSLERLHCSATKLYYNGSGYHSKANHGQVWN